MAWLMFLLSISVVTIVYYLSYFTVCILLGVNNKHYFLGFGGSVFEFKIRNVIFTVGAFIPFFGLARFCKVEAFSRRRAEYPWQFSNRPWLARAAATYGGVIGVLVFAIAVLTTVNFVMEERYISKEEVNKHGVYPSLLAESYGFERGDKILTINGQDFKSHYELLVPSVYEKAGNTFLVERKGVKRVIHVPEGNHNLPPGQSFLEILVPFEIDSVQRNSPAEQIGLQEGDRITEVNEKKVYTRNEMRKEFLADDDGLVSLQIQRLKDYDTLILQHGGVKLDERRNLGIFTRERINYAIKSYSFPDAVGKGLHDTFQLLRGHLDATTAKFRSNKKVSRGPISPSAAFGDNRYWQYFWYLTANFASICVIWNFLPYPRSGFWELIPLAYEGITRKKYSYEIFRGSLKWAWYIFFVLMLIALINHLRQLF